ncbi:MAG: sigma-54 dependent transcriptional regulator [Kiritimatiellia bacterium]|jgi:DNA-binding NtrC family response regulator|nr:sigma-54 dependent transcriptional regulator [Kiritimatiellia bacterium]MDP6629865.1 sigma-54 dependent transcriptional regulator [Kiritimatiellia bacterium]MDP6809712.1 sigma-54 dependent transcriptional regulator [Kiritimatiellia bacterium]MDP7025178.1 sigma-54 dependent transcriptional regulator [Kiritimatiellia bacterium]
MSTPAFPVHPVLLVDDDKDLLRNYVYTLRADGITNVITCEDGAGVDALMKEHEFDAVLLDLNMPRLSGRDVLPRIVQRHPDLPVIVVTGVDEVDTAVKCMRAGAFDYMVKPVKEEHLLTGLRRALDVRDVRRENALLTQHLLSTELTQPDAFSDIVTSDAGMRSLFQYIEAIAGTPQPILVTGETGVGKELIARAIHQSSGRTGEFIPVNIAGLDDNVFSDTLFGHVKGAFTGAMDVRKGLIERAEGGTLFLDEIGDLNSMSQVKLLRLVQEREYFALGSDSAKRTNARIVVATNRDLQTLQRSGDFREDLYFRLRSHHVNAPPLRERRGDLPRLLDHFLARSATEMKKKKPTPPPELVTLLSTYSFPGNIRELEAMCYDAVSTHKSGVLSMSTFRDAISREQGSVPELPALPVPSPDFLSPDQPLPSIRQAERLLIEEALRRTDGNQTMASQLLGITRQTLNRHLKNMRAQEEDQP